MFSLTGIQAKIAEYALCLFLVYLAYNWIGHKAVESYKAEVMIEQAIATQAQQAKYNKIAEEYELLKLTRASNAVTIKKETERVINNQPIVYAGNCLDVDGLRVVNQSLNPTSTNTSKPASTLPISE